MKNYLVIGGSNGIGKSIVEILHASGNKVWASYNHNQVSLPGVEYFKWQHQETFDQENLPETLDGLVYCPGSIDLKPFSRFKPQDFIDDFELQVIGAMRVLQANEKALKKSDNASVVLFSTVAVQQGFNFHTKVSTSKGAVEGLMRSLAAEWAPKVRVNAIAPSLTDTPLAQRLLGSDEKKQLHAERHPLKKIGEAKDIAGMAEFLLSQKSGLMTGQVLSVDGGMSRIKN